MKLIFTVKQIMEVNGKMLAESHIAQTEIKIFCRMNRGPLACPILVQFFTDFFTKGDKNKAKQGILAPRKSLKSMDEGKR